MRRRNSHMSQDWQTKGRKAGCSKDHHSPPHEKGRIRTEITYVKIRTRRAWRQNDLSPLHNNELYKIHGCWARFWADYHARRAVWWETITKVRVAASLTTPTSAPQLQNSILPLAPRNYSTLATPLLNLSWLTGFIEGEGCFSIIVTKNKNYKTALAVQLVFIIAVHERNQPVLILIKNCLGVGLIYRHSLRSIQLKVKSVKDFRVIINHFDKYPLITQS